MKKKILVTTGTRAEYGILRPLLNKLKISSKIELILVVTGTHLSKKHGYTINEIKKDGFKIHARVKMIPKKIDKKNLTKEIGNGIIQFTEIFSKFKPDINIVFGDRDAHRPADGLCRKAGTAPAPCPPARRRRARRARRNRRCCRAWCRSWENRGC